MDLSKLFPNSFNASMKVLEHVQMTVEQAAAFHNIVELARDAVKEKQPITVELISSTHTGNHYVKLARGEKYMIIASGHDRAWAQNRCAMAKHVLLGHPEPSHG